MGKTDKAIYLTIAVILLASTMLIMRNLPNYIAGTPYEILVWLLWGSGFAFAFAKISMG